MQRPRSKRTARTESGGVWEEGGGLREVTWLHLLLGIRTTEKGLIGESRQENAERWLRESRPAVMRAPAQRAVMGPEKKTF